MERKTGAASWEKQFPIPEAEKKKWEEAKSSESLLSYGLHHKIIPREEYFDWAIENYQMPLLKTDFFQNHAILNQNQWKAIKSLESWNSQMVPVWFWNNIVYIGCLEPPLSQPSFSHRFVLTTDLCLKMAWNSLQERMEITQSFSMEKAKLHSLKPEVKNLENKPLKKTALQSAKATKQNAPFNQSHDKIKDQNSKKVIHIKNYKKNINQAMTFKTDTSIHLKDKNTPYIKLCEKMKPWFVGPVIFKKEESKLVPLEYSGRILLDKDFSVNLKDSSFFSIINKNFPYHGPVISTKTNKEIFKNMKWEGVLPKHVSAIPLNTKKGEPLVFFGVGKRKISMNEIESITENVEEFFKKETEFAPLKKIA